METLQQHDHQQHTTKPTKKSKFTMLNPFNWINNNRNCETSQDTSGGQYHGNEESADMDIDGDDPAVCVNDMKLNFKEQQRVLDDFYLLDTLGKGMSGKVKKGQHTNTGDLVALKIIDRTTTRKRVLSQLHTEIMAMKSVTHPNILNLLHVSLNSTYPRKCGETRQVIVLGLELARGGELFDFMMYTGSFSEILARTFFRQMLQALKVCHDANIYHRDIKPENLLLDDKYQLKIADFGLAAIRNDKDVLLRTECGTRSYMAPEILAHQEYSGAKADVWSCAVVLFIMLAGNPPFTMAKKGDWWFNALLDNNYEKFWRAHRKYAPQLQKSAEEFLSQIFIPDAEKRPTIDAILKMPWMDGPTFSNDDLYQELLRRKSVVDVEKEKEREQARREKERKKGKQFDPFQAETVRSTGIEITEGDEIQEKYDTSILAPLLQREQKILGFTNFYTSAPVMKIVEDLKTALSMMDGVVKMKDDNSFTLKSTVRVKNKNSIGDSCDVKIQIFSVPEENVQFVNIQRDRGDPFVFNKLYSELLEKIPDLLVNKDEKKSSAKSNVPEGEILVDDLDMI